MAALLLRFEFFEVKRWISDVIREQFIAELLPELFQTPVSVKLLRAADTTLLSDLGCTVLNETARSPEQNRLRTPHLLDPIVWLSAARFLSSCVTLGLKLSMRVHLMSLLCLQSGGGQQRPSSEHV